LKSPTCPRGLLNWAVYVRSSQSRPRPVLFEHIRSDPRLSDSRETAISVLTMLEKAANGNGGAELLLEAYVEDFSWYSFTESEQEIIKKTTRRFVKELIRAGFMSES